MNIETAIKSRKDAFFAAYDIKDEGLLKEIEDLFNRISEFGKTCSDYMDFETKFATSPLNQEYINLFTKAATTGTSKLQPVQENNEPEISEEERLQAEMADDLRFAAKEATQPLRHQAYMAGTEAMRSTKVGNALFNLNNHLETANHFRKLAKEQKEMKKQAEESEK